jgi:hypothetical protein
MLIFREYLPQKIISQNWGEKKPGIFICTTPMNQKSAKGKKKKNQPIA